MPEFDTLSKFKSGAADPIGSGCAGSGLEVQLYQRTMCRVAQLVELWNHTPVVVGSNPTPATSFGSQSVYRTHKRRVRRFLREAETATSEFAHLAQLVEQLTCNQQVVSSILTMGTTNPNKPFYGIYSAIKTRCYNSSHPTFKWYGARGIKMHESWIHDYQAFQDWILANLGQRPDGLTLDRRDNDGDYAPGNLRWATKSEQSFNQRPRTMQ